jgi:type VI secretion system secreted protein VgrG
MPILDLSLSLGELSVCHFSVHDATSTLFSVSLRARTPDPSLDLAAIIGRPAAFRIESGLAFARRAERAWSGICSYIEQVEAEPSSAGLSTYQLRIVPTLWHLTQRRGHRIFQHLAIPEIIAALLAEWSIVPTWRIDSARYPKLEYKVQYGESDYAFFCRLLEEAGISFHFSDDTGESQLVLAAEPQAASPRALPLPFVDSPNQSAELEFITGIRLAHEVRPGAHTVRDHDFRNPAFALFGEAPKANHPEDCYEQFYYRPGASLTEERHDHNHGHGRAADALAGARMGREAIAFETNALDLLPGTVFSTLGHPHAGVTPGRKLLVTELSIEGAPGEEWSTSGRAVFADVPHRPPHVTPRPTVRSVQCATVVGPSGQEIHTDEFGRVRVQFPWDREGKHDDHSSCWIRVNQGWGGRGYGMHLLPRIGQEVLISFLDGDPDQPVVVGRVFNQTHPVPYRLPDHKTISTWKSDSSPGSGGFNEIKLEDKKGDELVYLQAERNQRTLVKHDETITVLRHREKHVGVNETDTTGIHRTEITGVHRTETTGANRLTLVGGRRAKLVRGERSARAEGSRRLRVGNDHDGALKGKKRELVGGDRHLEVKGKRSERIDQTQSLVVVEDQQEKVGGSFALVAGKQIHFAAGEVMVGEAPDITVKGPGGFIRIDAGGVTIKGTRVKINAGGKSGKGRGSKPEKPEAPDGPSVVDLQWSRQRIPVGETVQVKFTVKRFLGDEDVVVTIYECDHDGKRTSVAIIPTKINKTDGLVQVDWRRDEDDAEADLRTEQASGDTGPLEYRFDVSTQSAHSENLSGPLWLTNTVEIDMIGTGGAMAAGVEIEVAVNTADGEVLRATTRSGKARFENVVVGPLAVSARLAAAT